MILLCERRSKERHDTITHHLVDRAPIMIDGLHHAAEDGIEKPARLIGIEIGDTFRRSLYVCEKNGDLLSFALQRGLG